MKQISPNLYQLPLGAVNTFVIPSEDGLTLIDTGYKGSTDKIFKAFGKIGKGPSDLKRIILTHSHPDHAGSAAALKKATGATVYMHAADAELVRKGVAGRLPHRVSPGLVNNLVFRFFIKNLANEVEATEIEEEIKEGDVLPFGGGLRVVHTPGHSLGHICLLMENEGMLIAGDLCANMMGLGLSTVYEDPELGVKSIKRIAAMDFERACFGHGGSIKQNAALKMRKKF